MTKCSVFPVIHIHPRLHMLFSREAIRMWSLRSLRDTLRSVATLLPPDHLSQRPLALRRRPRLLS